MKSHDHMTAIPVAALRGSSETQTSTLPVGQDPMLREDAIEDVIRQFADPMAFLRELVQNALDAGSQEVEVRFEYDETHQAGVASIVDFGEGMSRDIIETRLVRLFNSTKDDDFTKIGKFGIGFVSVFAMKPVVVCVDTGRDGQYWRLLLHPDRSYELVELDHPVEGTAVSLHLDLDPDEFEQFQRSAKGKLVEWCRFAPVPIWFEGEDLREEFELSGLIVESFEEEGTRVVAALHKKLNGQGEFFNGGLALQTVASEWPHVSFMMDSRYLEHTLTRDQVLQNKKFHAAVARLNHLVEVRLLESLEEGLRSWSSDPDRVWEWVELCGIARGYLRGTRREARFPVIGGAPLAYSKLKDARDRNRLMLTRGRSHVAHLMPQDYVLLDVRPFGGAYRLLRDLLDRDVPILEDVWVHPPLVDVAEIPGATALATEVEAALRLLGSSPTWVGYAQFDYPYSGLDGRGLLLLPDRKTVHHRADIGRFSLRGTNADVLLNPEHHLLSDAIAVAETEPEWAGYTVVKCAALSVDAVENGELDGATDATLALQMLERRSKRLAQ